MNYVSILKCEEYDLDVLTDLVTKQFNQLNFSELLFDDIRVVLKPNLVLKRSPECAATTHPMVVRAVIRVLRQFGVKNIVLAESSGGLYSRNNMNNVYKGTGIKEACDLENVEIYDEYKHRSVSFPNGKAIRFCDIIEPILDADLVVNLGKLKTHGLTTYTGCAKNIFGVVPGLMKPELHSRFPDLSNFGEMLCDITDFVNPQINILDGILAMEGEGPGTGTPRKMNVMLASGSAFACDIVACDIIGINPMEIANLSAAVNRGIVEVDKIEVIGDDIEQFKINDLVMPKSYMSIDFADRLPKFLRKPAKRVMAPRPVIIKKDCVGCSKCAESCPKHIIDIKNKKAVINYPTCIKCFCCHEMCPYKAVEIKRFSLLKH